MIILGIGGASWQKEDETSLIFKIDLYELKQPPELNIICQLQTNKSMSAIDWV